MIRFEKRLQPVPSRRGFSTRWLCAVVVATPIALVWAVGLSAANTATAHGPTVELSHQEMKPALLNLFVGTTVHFENTVQMPGGHVVVDSSGEIESPALLEPGDGWHYTFEKEGTFELFIRQHPAARMKVVVVPRRGAAPKPTPAHDHP